MGLNYRHLLVPISAQFRPDAATVGRFLRQVVEAGYLGDDYQVVYQQVLKGIPRPREMRNPITGETIRWPGRSRQYAAPQPLGEPEEVATTSSMAAEYDVAIASEGIPFRRALDIGSVEQGPWRRFERPCHLEIRCRVRSHVVRLYDLRSADELNRPPDFANPTPPMFDEDCSADENDGLFVHPEAGVLRIAGAGCASFWVEFNYGKFVFPRLEDRGVELLDRRIVLLARDALGTDFV